MVLNRIGKRRRLQPRQKKRKIRKRQQKPIRKLWLRRKRRRNGNEGGRVAVRVNQANHLQKAKLQTRSNGKGPAAKQRVSGAKRIELFIEFLEEFFADVIKGNDLLGKEGRDKLATSIADKELKASATELKALEESFAKAMMEDLKEYKEELPKGYTLILSWEVGYCCVS